MKFRKNQKGFTLVELLIVVVILGILAAVAIPRFLTTRDKSQQRACQANLTALNSSIEEYAFLNSTALTAATFITAVTGTDSLKTSRFPDGPPKCPKDGALYTLDTNGRAKCTNNSAFAGYAHVVGYSTD